MFLRLIVEMTIAFHEASIYGRCVRAASLRRLPVQMRASYCRRSRIFQGKSPDEHAARIQVSAGERRDAVHRRQPHSRRTRAQEHSALFVQGDESFLMESLSIHLLSYHHNHRRLAAPLKYPD